MSWALSSATLWSRYANGLRRCGWGWRTGLDNAIGSLSGGQRQALTTLLMASWPKPTFCCSTEHTAAL